MLGGLIAGALTGAAKGVGEASDVMLGQQNKLDLAKAMSDMEEQKLLRLDENKRRSDIDDIGKKATATAAAAPIVARGAVGGQVATEDEIASSGLAVKQATNKVANQVADLTASKNANLDQLRADAEADRLKAIADATVKKGVPAAEAAAIKAKLLAGKDNTTEAANQAGAAAATQLNAEVGTPGYLTNIKNKKLAEHVESSGSVAQAKLANFQLGRLQAVAKLQDDLDAAEQNGATSTSKQIRTRISSLGFSGKADVKTYLSSAEAALKAASLEMDPDQKAKLYERANALFAEAGLDQSGQNVDLSKYDKSKKK